VRFTHQNYFIVTNKFKPLIVPDICYQYFVVHKMHPTGLLS